MNWIPLTDEAGLEEIKNQSLTKTQVIFKHSTRCSISTMAKSRLERSTAPDTAHFYYLDLIAFRSISNAITATFDVAHASPQILVIKNGACVYNESHSAIDMDEIIEQL